MQVTKIALACALACAGTSAQAAVLSATNVIYISGASAQTPGLAKSMGAFCNTVVDTYVDDQDGKQAFVYSCSSAKATSGLTAGSSFIVVKSDAGGSANGVAPVVNLTNIKFPDINNCSATVTAGYNANNTVGTVAGSCAYSVAGVNKVPQVGLTDVPAAVWKARGQFTPVAGALYTTKAGFAGQGFGVAVSPLLYTALQNDQIAGGLLAATCTGVATAGDCQPSISKAQYANIVAANPGSPYQQNWNALLPHLPAGTVTGPVTLERRTSTSGTQASSDVYFLDAPCKSLTAMGGALGPATAGTYDAFGVISTDPTYSGIPAFVVVENSSTGNVKAALGAGYTIGVMSLENAQPASGWKWVKLNGVSPNLNTNQKSTTVDGLYDFAYETEMLYRNDAVVAAKNVANALVTEMGNGANLAVFPGLYADPASGAAYVAGQTHKGSRGNNVCQNHLMYF